MLNNLQESHIENTVIIGDFNVPEFIDNPNNRFAALLQNFSNFHNLSQLNTIRNKLDRILDLVYTNILCTITQSEEPVVDEDAHHPALNIHLEYKVNSNTHHFSMNPTSKETFGRLISYYCMIYYLP